MSVNSINSAQQPQQITTFERAKGKFNSVSELALGVLSDVSMKGKDLAKATITWVKSSPAFFRSFFSEQGKAQYSIISELKPSIERFFLRNTIELTPELSGKFDNLTASLQKSLEKEFAKPIQERSIKNLPEGEQLLLVMHVLGLQKGTTDEMSAILKSELNFTVSADKGSHYANLYKALHSEVLPELKAHIHSSK